MPVNPGTLIPLPHQRRIGRGSTSSRLTRRCRPFCRRNCDQRRSRLYSRSGSRESRCRRYSQVTSHLIQEPTVRPNLTHIPNHHPSEAGKSLAVGNDISEKTPAFVATACCSYVPGNAQKDLHVRIQAHCLRPIIPGREVEVVLSARS